jgi:hypothetical protein
MGYPRKDPPSDEAHLISFESGLTDAELFSTVRRITLNREKNGTGAS